MPAKPLTENELAEAAKLKRLFEGWQQRCREAGEAYSQEAIASRLGFGQSALSQYLNGRIPLNMEAAVSFAKVLHVKVDQFSLTIADEIRDATKVVDSVAGGVGAGAPQWISSEAYRLLDLYYAADQDGRNEIMATANEARKVLSALRAASNES